MSDELMKLEQAASEGHGLWIGLFPAPDPTLEEQGLRIGEYYEQNPHVTLAHLGRGKTGRVRPAAATCGSAADRFAPIASKIHGVARLEQSRGSAIVGLVHGVDMIRNYVFGALPIGFVDVTFGWTAHMTAAKIQMSERAYLPKVSRPLAFTAITLVCGDARMNFPLMGR